MGTISIELREYPQDQKVEIEELTSDGAWMLHHDCKQLLSDLEDQARKEEPEE